MTRAKASAPLFRISHFQVRPAAKLWQLLLRPANPVMMVPTKANGGAAMPQAIYIADDEKNRV